MKNYVSLEIIYFYILLKTCVFCNSKKGLERLKKFLSLDTFKDKIYYSKVKNNLENIFDIGIFASNVIDNNDFNEIVSLEKIIYKKFFPYNFLGVNREDIITRLNYYVDEIKKYEKNELFDFFIDVCKFLSDKFNSDENSTKSLELIILYIYINDYLTLFDDLESLEFNNEAIADKFNVYFKYLNKYPQNIIFYNSKNNIRIMQNLFPSQEFIEVLKLLGYKKTKKEPQEYLLMEVDEKLLANNNGETICHEVGHLLNIKLFDFQTAIVNELYSQNNAVNIQILNLWLNEIIADVLGYNISLDKKSYINFFENLAEEQQENWTYPPNKLRKAFISDCEFSIDDISDSAIKTTVEVLIENKDYIKNMLSCVKRDK